ncbi:MAG: arginine N-succinyltransferase [Bacteriovoracaceae bacterium]|jgi:arginine N-succinyltransferase|nr:arginine N-succinyltransferase [Bacteriovoracaceae bacterium]
MFIIRSVTSNDLNDVYELSKLVLFINLPPDKEIVQNKIKNSIQTFRKPFKDLHKNYYIFVLEDLETGNVIGVSLIHARHGTDSEPHFFLRVGQEHKFSSTINTGFIHGTLKLGYDIEGPSEIGGIVINHAYRGNPEKLGKQLSFIRFLYMGLYPERFSPVIHTELMPPLDKEGKSPLWEAVGRKFLNMDYHEADILSRSNKEFILNLFPSDNIYVNLLPVEARDSIGRVGPDTQGVKKMLEGVGFKYINEVDPFDGGPHYRCPLKEISSVKNMQHGRVELGAKYLEDQNDKVLIQIPSKNHDFLATSADINFKNGVISLPQNLIQELKLDKDFETSFIYLD